MKITTTLLLVATIATLSLIGVPGFALGVEVTQPTVTGGQGGSLQGPNISGIGNPDTFELQIFGPDIIGIGNPEDFVMTPPTIILPR